MRRLFTIMAAVLLLLLISSCSYQTYVLPASYFFRPMEYNFVSKDMIEEGDRLKAKHPDEDFLYRSWQVTYTFNVDEGKLKKADNNKTSKKKKKKKSDDDFENRKKFTGARVTYVNGIRTSKRIDEKTVDQVLKDIDTDESDWDKTAVTIDEKHMVDVVALQDNLNYDHVIFYDGTTSVSGIGGQYANTSSSRFIVPAVTKNYEDAGIFHSDEKLAIMSIPTYVLGNSVQLDYNLNYRDYRYLTSVYFSEDYFIKEKIISFEIPEGLDVELIEMNFNGYDITRTEGAPPAPSDDVADDEDEDDGDSKSKKKKKKSSSKKKKKKKSKGSSSGNTKTINYIVKNMPAMKREAYNYGPSHSIPHLLVLCKSYTNGSDTTSLMRSTDDLYSWYNTLTQKMDNKQDDIKKTAEKLIADKTTDEEKISAIFYWVQDNIRYIAFEDGLAGFVPDDCQSVFNKRYGDCKGMANLTKEMLKSVGYDARLTWIGTDRIAYDGTTPSLSAANHMICVVYPDSTNKSKRYFLDGTESFVSFGDYAKRIQGRRVVIEDGEKYIVDSVPEFDHLHNKVVKTENFTIENKLVKGTVKRTYHGESKTNVIRSYDNMRLDERERALRGFLNNNDFNLSVSGMSHTDFGVRNQPFEISYNVEARNRVIENGNQLYVNTDWDREWANYRIDTARLTHYSFLHKKHTVKTSTIAIPAGYKVASLPAALTITNDYFAFKLSYAQQGNTVVYTKEISLPKGYLSRSEIRAWNEAVEKLTDFYDSYIVLTK